MPQPSRAIYVPGRFSSAWKSLNKRSNAGLYESRSVQNLKSGMKYSRISRAESLPVSASEHFHSWILAIGYWDENKLP